MKYILILLPIILLSCSKPNDSIQNETVPEPPVWIGTYTNSAGDTSFVSQNGTYCKIEWMPKDLHHSLIFDSVRVAPDFSFTTNEVTESWRYSNAPPFYETITAVGTGKFITNKIDFHFTVDGSGDIFYSGIKRN